MKLEFREIHGEGRDYRERVLALYEASFSPMERKPVASLEKTFRAGKMKILAVCEGEDFVALAVLMSDGKLNLLDYLAVVPRKRDRGYGGEILRQLRAASELPLAVEIERLDENAEDNGERIRRRNFYLRNGFESSGTFIWLWHVEYELLCAGGSVSYEQYLRLQNDCLGSRGRFLREIR